LQIKNNYQSLLATLANNEMQINQLNYQVIELKSQKIDQTQRLLSTLKEAYNNLKASITEWEKAYILSTPIEGKITFTKYWSKNQYVLGGDIVFTVVPDIPKRIIGRIKLPASGSGKVETGQLVHIRLDNFPYMEFGMVEGKIESISLIPETGQSGTFYTAEVSLPYNLTTSYKKTLPFSQEMHGSAEIVTKNLSLFERLIQPLKAAIHK
jgi:HlyD family secretion protein